MKITAWGKYPTVEATVHCPATASCVRRLLGQAGDFTGIPRGLGRSYGDSSLAPSMLDTRYLNHLLGFDPATGLLRCSAGTSLADILDVYVPQGWFLPVTPGTKFVTVGGAIAADVHGKNHHIAGTITDHIDAFSIMLANGETLECSRRQHSDLFRATCGGMGLTGVILDATLKLIPINSALIRQRTLKAGNLTEALALFEEHADTTYSVAWIDCLSSGAQLGRSLLMLGEHEAEGPLQASAKAKLAIPFDLPEKLLNQFTIRSFNSLYYHRIRKPESVSRLHFEPFFYPLDSIAHWNRLYGKRGFTQYQFVVPRAAGLEGMSNILQRIAQSARGSFLAVLKAFGPANDNYLSFPTDGYTLALDFKVEPGLFALLDELDRMVLDHDGRIYLAKDVRMSEATFKSSYPQWETFQAVRERYHAIDAFRSLQSRRLGL